MKLLWVKSDFLHPTNRGGQIRTLEMLKRLHARHEVHYVGLNYLGGEGVARAGEYCTKAYPIEHVVPDKTSLAFGGQLLAGLVSPLPVAVSRYRSDQMKLEIERLSRLEKFDAVVCDFLFPAPNIHDLSSCVLFEHNVEATIWKRHVENAASPVRRAYFRLQAERMFAYERQVCNAVKSVIAVSDIDAAQIRSDYGVQRVNAVSTGVDLEYFAPPAAALATSDLVFVGSMDWMPNIDGSEWFVSEVLPLIREKRPDCTLSLAGRKPTRALQALAMQPGIHVTGTVDDVRPHVWGATVSIVPLRVGGGTRLKIFESMAARVAVVSTTIGAEGLPVKSGTEIYIADQPQDFADRCLELLDGRQVRTRMAQAAWELVSARFSWESVSLEFERLLQS